MKKNPLEGKEIRMGEGIVLEPYCKCGAYGFGFHVLETGKKLDKKYVEDACCIECGSQDLEWLPAGYSEGKVIMKKGWMY